jgi:S1/P1 Nuclease
MWRCRSLFTILLISVPAQCWWEEGHQVVARIAVRHLSDAASLRISQILDVENTPEAVADAMATASIWADQVKADTGTGNWHFIDLTLQDSRANISDRCPNDNCVTARVRLFAEQLKAAATDDDSLWSDLEALRFLVHFVGDLHQPLHAISNADQGGNCETLDSPVGQAKNVHALWDGPLVSSMGADDTALAAELDKEITALKEDERSAFSSGDENDWAWESHRLAIVNVYKRLNMPKRDILFPTSCSEAPEAITNTPIHIDDQYTNAMEPLVREQLMKAGLRLAKLLNDIFA